MGFELECLRVTLVFFSKVFYSFSAFFYSLLLVAFLINHIELKSTATLSLVFSRASGSWLVFTLSSHWLLIKFSFLVIGCSDCVGCGFTSLNWKALFFLRRPFYFCLRRTSNIFEIRKEDLTQFVVTFQQTELLGKLSGFKSLSYLQGLLFKVTYVATDRHS